MYSFETEIDAQACNVSLPFQEKVKTNYHTRCFLYVGAKHGTLLQLPFSSLSTTLIVKLKKTLNRNLGYILYINTESKKYYLAC